MPTLSNFSKILSFLGMNCQKDKCLALYNLYWYNQEPCEANVVCSQIFGNICGDYALGVSFKSTSASQANTLCERGDLIQGSLAPGGSLMIYMFRNVKYVNDIQFQCYMWCADKGYV